MTTGFSKVVFAVGGEATDVTVHTARVIEGHVILDYEQAAKVADFWTNRAGDFLTAWTYENRNDEAGMIFAETGPDGIEINIWSTIGPDNDEGRYIGQRPLSNRYDTAEAPFADKVTITIEALDDQAVSA